MVPVCQRLPDRQTLVFGQEMMGLDQYQAILSVAGEKNVPVIMDADLGHLAPMMPIVTGSLAEVRVCDNDITIVMTTCKNV